MHAANGRTYLDYNASAPLLPAARNAFVRALETHGNPSSVHREGRSARAIVEDAREAVAALVGYHSDGVVFTSGASEAAATCLSPIWLEGTDERPIRHLAVLDTDHDCLREGGRFDRDRVVRLAVDAAGVVAPQALRDWMRSIGDEPALLALCLANNETGVVQPLAAYAEAIAAPNVTIVLDAVQAAGRISIDEWAAAADAVLLSGHKLGAATGVGAFALRDPARRPFPLIRGGGQESYRRAGTEAVPAIASFGAVARRVDAGDATRLRSLRDRLEARVSATGATIVSQAADRLPNTTLIHHPAVPGETAQIALDLQGFAVSSGSACSSGKVGASHVLRALEAAGAPVVAARGAIRVSTGAASNEAEIDAFCAAYERLVANAVRAERRVA